jgi:hypothetical protein
MSMTLCVHAYRSEADHGDVDGADLWTTICPGSPV